MREVSADGSTRVDTGKYVIYPNHNPRRLIEDVDIEEYAEFKKSQDTFRVRD